MVWLHPKHLFFLIFMGFMSLRPFSLYAQNDQNTDIYLQLSTDNDAFVFWNNSDRFYTYGIGVDILWEPNSFLGLEKRHTKKKRFLVKTELRSEGYTSTKKYVTQTQVENDSVFFDRPFAGLLYGKLSLNYIHERSYFTYEFLAGVMGPSSFAREIQDWFHKKITGDGILQGWEFQIPDQPIFNLNFDAFYDLTPQFSGVDIFMGANSKLGNLYIETTPVVGLRLGKFGQLRPDYLPAKSGKFMSKTSEIFLKSTFSTTFAAFDATAQGNLFHQDFEYRVRNLSHFFMCMTHGVFVNTDYGFSFFTDFQFQYGKVLKGSRHIYGRIGFAFNF